MNKQAALGWCIALGLVLTGCNRESSCNIKTEGLFCDFKVTRQPSGIVARADIWVGDSARGTSVDFECGEIVAVNGTELKEKQLLNTFYEAEVSSASKYEFVFTRPDETPYTSSVNLPAEVVLEEFEGEGQAEISRANHLEIKWTDNGPSNGIVTVDITGRYIDTIREEAPDTGAYTVAAGDLMLVEEGEPVPDDFPIYITVSRQNTGTMDSNLDGAIRATSLDSATITSVP